MQQNTTNYLKCEAAIFQSTFTMQPHAGAVPTVTGVVGTLMEGCLAAWIDTAGRVLDAIY